MALYSRQEHPRHMLHHNQTCTVLGLHVASVESKTSFVHPLRPGPLQNLLCCLLKYYFIVSLANVEFGANHHG